MADFEPTAVLRRASAASTVLGALSLGIGLLAAVGVPVERTYPWLAETLTRLDLSPSVVFVWPLVGINMSLLGVVVVLGRRFAERSLSPPAGASADHAAQLTVIRNLTMRFRRERTFELSYEIGCKLKALGDRRYARDAIAWLRRCSELRPRDQQPLDRIAEIHLDILQDPHASLEWFHKSLALHRSSWIHDRIAEVHLLLGDTSAAIRHFGESAATEPGNAWPCWKQAEVRLHDELCGVRAGRGVRVRHGGPHHRRATIAEAPGVGDLRGVVGVDESGAVELDGERDEPGGRTRGDRGVLDVRTASGEHEQEDRWVAEWCGAQHSEYPVIRPQSHAHME